MLEDREPVVRSVDREQEGAVRRQRQGPHVTALKVEKGLCVAAGSGRCDDESGDGEHRAM